MPGPLSGQLLVSAIWSLVGVVVGGRNQIGKAQIHVPDIDSLQSKCHDMFALLSSCEIITNCTVYMGR